MNSRNSFTSLVQNAKKKQNIFTYKDNCEEQENMVILDN